MRARLFLGNEMTSRRGLPAWRRPTASLRPRCRRILCSLLLVAAPCMGQGITAGLSIDAGAEFATSATVTLAITAPPGAEQVEIANQADFRGSQMFPVAPEIPWKLRKSGRERTPRTVYARFNGVGVDSSLVYSDDIVLDRKKPVIRSISVVRRGSVSKLTLPNFTVTVMAVDNVSPRSALRFQIADSRNFDDVPITSARRKTISTSRRTIFVRVFDEAGNFRTDSVNLPAGFFTPCRTRFCGPRSIFKGAPRRPKPPTCVGRACNRGPQFGK